MSLTAEQESQLLARKRELHRTGNPVEAMKVGEAMDAGVMPDSSLLTLPEGIKADVPLMGDVELEIPPRHGKGSGIKAWATFAAKVTDMDAEVISRLQRDDIIATLEARGNIPSE